MQLRSIRKLAMLAGMAGLATLTLTAPARADVILVFGQNGTGNTVTATNNVGGTSTAITASNVSVLITGFAGGGTPILANFNLMATSFGTATMATDGSITQHFTGDFSFTAGTTNYLSGHFVDSVFGAGTGLTLTASSAQLGDILTFTSNVLSPSQLGAPTAISFGFSNVTPPASITAGGSLAAFTSSIAGDASATSTSVVPEPATVAMALTALPLLGLGAWARRRRAQA